MGRIKIGWQQWFFAGIVKDCKTCAKHDCARCLLVGLAIDWDGDFNDGEMKMSYKYLLGVLLLAFSLSVAAQNDARFLGSVNAEAQLVGYVFNARNDTDKTGQVLDYKYFDVRYGRLPAGLSRNEFVDALKRNFLGSYSFFIRLDEQDRDAVYQKYLQTPVLSNIRMFIHGLVKTSRKG